MQDLVAFISKHLLLSSIFTTLLIILFIVELLRLQRGSRQLNHIEATKLINHENAIVIDMRDSQDFKSGHIIEAKWFARDALNPTNKKIEKFKNKPIILICQTGNESQKVAALLTKHGYNASSLAGGMRAWREADMPIVKE